MQSATATALEPSVVVSSEVMQKLMAMVERVSASDAAVLIVGETGSGKELIARALHQQSRRNNQPFVDVNCAAVPNHLVESELFGHDKGAFSGADAAKPGFFELADKGTLLLDEIGELEPRIQAKLLRVLDGHGYYRLGGSRKISANVRVLGATNRDLEQEVAAGTFRRDLYHRLAQFYLRVPPLRERPEDIVTLAEFFLHKQLPAARFSREAMNILQGYSWPGNVRELKNLIFETAIHAKPGLTEVRARDLPSILWNRASQSSAQGFQGSLEEMEKQMILQALARNAHNQAKAAEQLGISGRTLRRKLKRYGEADSQADGVVGSMSSGQQRYFRVTLDIPVFLLSNGERLEAKSVNISAGGIAIECQAPLVAGAALEVSFTLPGSSAPIETKVKVMWTDQKNAGLSFVETHPAVQQELRRWITKRALAEGWVPAKDED